MPKFTFEEGVPKERFSFEEGIESPTQEGVSLAEHQQLEADWEKQFPPEPAPGFFKSAARGIDESLKATAGGVQLPLATEDELAEHLQTEMAKLQREEPPKLAGKAGAIAGSLVGTVGQALATSRLGKPGLAAQFASQGAYEAFMHAGMRSLAEGKDVKDAVKIGRTAALAGMTVGAGTALLFKTKIPDWRAAARESLKMGAAGAGGRAALNVVEQQLGLKTPIVEGVLEQGAIMGALPAAGFALPRVARAPGALRDWYEGNVNAVRPVPMPPQAGPEVPIDAEIVPPRGLLRDVPRQLGAPPPEPPPRPPTILEIEEQLRNAPKVEPKPSAPVIEPEVVGERPVPERPRTSEAKSDESIASESTDDLVARTTVGADRDKAFTDRAEAIKRVILSLKKGDVVVTKEGDRYVVSQVFKDGTTFVYPEGNPNNVGEYSVSAELANGGRIERTTPPLEPAQEVAAEGTAVPETVKAVEVRDEMTPTQKEVGGSLNEFGKEYQEALTLPERLRTVRQNYVVDYVERFKDLSAQLSDSIEVGDQASVQSLNTMLVGIAKSLKAMKDNKFTYGSTGGKRISIVTALRNREPVNASAAEFWGMKIPDGYVREGEQYVYKPPVRAAEPEVAPTAQPTPPEPAKAEVQVLEPIPRTTPAEGTPERDAIERAAEEADKRREAAYEAFSKVKEQMDKVGRFTEKWEKLDKRREKLLEKYNQVKEDTQAAWAARRQAILEDRANVLNPFRALSAREDLGLEKRAYEKKKELARAEAKRQGATEAEAEQVAMDTAIFGAFKDTESIVDSVKFRLQSQRFDAQKKTVQSEFDKQAKELNVPRHVLFERIKYRIEKAYNEQELADAKSDAEKMFQERRSELEQEEIVRQKIERERQEKIDEAVSKGHKYFAHRREAGVETFSPVEGKPVNLPEVPWAKDYFAYKSGDQWMIIEPRSGFSVGKGKTLVAAKADATTKLKTVGEEKTARGIEAAIKTHGESPTTAKPKGIAASARNKPAQPLGGESGAINLGAIADSLERQREAILSLGRSVPNRNIMDQTFDAADTLAATSAQQARNHISIGTTPIQRDAAMAIVEANGNRARLTHFLAQAITGNNKRAEAAVRYAQANWGALQALAGRVKATLDNEIAHEQYAGINTEYREGYVPHLYDTDLWMGQGRPYVFGRSGSGVSSGFKKGRTFDTIFDAIEAGYVPKSMDVGELVEHRVKVGQRMINRRLWAEALRSIDDPSDGNPIVTSMVQHSRGPGKPGYEAAPKGYAPREVLPGIRVAVHEGYTPLFDALTGTSRVSGSTAGYLALKGAGAIKHGLLLFDSFHMGRMWMRQLFLTGKPEWNKGASLLEYADADLNRAVTERLITSEIANWVRTNRPKAQLLMRSGLNVGRIQEALYTSFVRDTPGLKQTVGAFNKWIFEKLTRGAMMESALIEFERIKAAMPHLTDEQVARQVARDMNVYFGNIGSQGLFKSRTWQDISRLLMLAPQWVESMARLELKGAAQAVKGVTYDPAVHRRILIGSLGKGLAQGLLAMFLGAQIINLVTRKKPTWENEEHGHKLDAWIPDVTGKSPGFFLSPLSVQAELTHDFIRYNDVEPSGSKLKTAWRIAQNKASPYSRALKVLSLGRDWDDRQLISDWDRVKAAGWALAPTPIPLSSLTRQNAPPGSLQRQLTASIGLKTEPAPRAGQQIFQLLNDWMKNSKDAKIQDQWEQKQESKYAQSRYRDLEQALRVDDLKKAREEYQKLRDLKKTPVDIVDHFAGPHHLTSLSIKTENDFKKSLTPEQLKLYEQAIADRKALFQKFSAFRRTLNP